MTAPHADFSSAPEGQRWTGPLEELFATLGREAYRAGGGWSRRVLPRGAWVSMRIPPESFPRKELRIARREGPEGHEAEAAWARELDTFVKHAAKAVHPKGQWYPTKDDRAGGAVKQTYVELFPLEVAPDRVRCQGEPDCEAVITFSQPGALWCPACKQKRDVREVVANIGHRKPA